MSENVVVNKAPDKSGVFDYRDLKSIKNHWLKIKGKVVNGKKEGICLVYLFNGDRIYCKFEADVANGKGIYFKRSGEKIIGV